MASKLGAILAAAGATVGCAEAAPPAIGPGIHPTLAAAELATVGAPGLPDIPFGEALVGFSRRLSELHAFDPQADARIHEAILVLATILDRMPAASAEPSLRRTAGLIRANEAPEGPSIETTKRSLAAAAVVLLQLVPTLYRDFPEVGAHARAFGGAVSAIDAAREPPDRAGVIAALVRAERVLGAMYSINVGPPPP